MKKHQTHRAICLAAAAALCCAPLTDLKGIGIHAAAAEEPVGGALVPVIVTVSGDALLATPEGAAQGSDFIGTDEAEKLAAALEAVQKKVQDEIRGFYPALEVRFSYNVLLNGFSCDLPENLIPVIGRLPLVESVARAEDREAPRMAQAAALGGFPAYYDATGCTGEGQVIAVIDSELDVTNPMFSALEDKDVALTKADIAEIAENVGFNVDIDPEKAYINSKLPYVIDYLEDPYADIPDTASYHGTHVAGIAAGNEITDYNGNKISGVAKDAQIVFMAIGSSTMAGMISEEAAIAATEDAIKLHADVINMSFGGAGEPAEDDPMDALYETARNAGVVICKAAGNSGNGNVAGEINLPENPDTGTLDSFAAGAGILSVASAENTYTQHNRAFRIGEELIPYTEYYTAETGLKKYYLADELSESEYEFVNLTDLMTLMGGMTELSDDEEPIGTDPQLIGEEDEPTEPASEETDPEADSETDPEAVIVSETDPDGSELGEQDPDLPDDTEITDPGEENEMDLTGKIAVLSAGLLSAAEMAEMASFFHAEAAIVIGEAGIPVTGAEIIDPPIPCALVAYEDGAKLLASEETTLVFTDDTVDIDLPTQVSYYSSWGVHQSLELRPDIMGIGGNVESASYYGGQSIMSGTSMATPYLTGCTAVLTEYLKKNGFSLTGAEKFDYVRDLLLNTAIPYEQGGMLVSPRQQGAGFVSLNNALAAKVLMTGKEGAAKINLYDGIADSFTFPVTLTNISDADVTFKEARLVLTTDNTKMDEELGLEVIDGQQQLSAAAGLSGLLSTAAGETRTEEITVQLNAKQTAKIAETFTNGFFIDGFLLLSGADNCCDISIPVLGFRGDWAALPIFAEDAETDVSFGGTAMRAGYSFTDYLAVVNDVLSRVPEEEFAENALLDLFYNYAEEADFDRLDSLEPGEMLISPNGDGLSDDILHAVTALRFAKAYGLKITDAEGNVVDEGGSVTFPMKGMPYPLTPAQPLSSLRLEDGSYTASYSASIYYEPSRQNPQTDSFSFTVDSTAPEITTEITEENGRRILKLTASDKVLDGIFIAGTGKGGIAGEYDPDAEPGDPMQTVTLIGTACSMNEGNAGAEPGEVKSDTLPLLAKILLDRASDADLADIDFTDLILAEPDDAGSFTVEYDITDMTAYSFTAFDRAMNMAVFETEAPAAETIANGIWKNQDRVFAFTDSDGSYARFSDGTRADFTYTLENGTAEFVFADQTLTAAVEQVNSMTLRLTWADGTVEMLYFDGEGTLDEFVFYSAAEIEEAVLTHYAENYADIVSYDLTRWETLFGGDGSVMVKLYCEIDGSEMLLGLYQVDIFSGEGADVLGMPFTMNPIAIEDSIKPGMWIAVTEDSADSGYYWFDGENSGSYRALADGTGTDFGYALTAEGLVVVPEGSDEVRQAQVIPIDEENVVLLWEDETSELLVYKSDEGFDTFDFYTIPELEEMSMTDYEQKNGTRPESAETYIDETGTLVVQMTDAAGEIADTYSVDANSGIGEDADGGEVNLPQTGNNAVQPITLAAIAVLLTLAGALAMAKSGIIRRKEEER